MRQERKIEAEVAQEAKAISPEGIIRRRKSGLGRNGKGEPGKQRAKIWEAASTELG